MLGNDIDPDWYRWPCWSWRSQPRHPDPERGRFLPLAPNANFVGTDTFTYEAQTSSGSLSGLATVTLAVEGPVVAIYPGNLLPQDAAGNPSSPVGARLYANSSAYDSTLGLIWSFGEYNHPGVTPNWNWTVTGGPYTVQSTNDPTQFSFTPLSSGKYVVSLSFTDPTGVGTASQTFDVTPVVNISRTAGAPGQGALDPTFGTGGIQTTNLGSPDDEATNVFSLADGKSLWLASRSRVTVLTS